MGWADVSPKPAGSQLPSGQNNPQGKVVHLWRPVLNFTSLCRKHHWKKNKTMNLILAVNAYN